MSELTKQIASDTLKKIIDELRTLEGINNISITENIQSTELDIAAILKSNFEAAYKKVEVGEKPALYKDFSLIFHSDKLKSHKEGQELYEFLLKKNLHDEPFKIIGLLNAENFVQDVKTDPLTAVFSGSTYIVEFVIDSYKMLDRYPQPLRFLAKASAFIASLGVCLSSIVSLVIGALVGKGLNLLQRLIEKTINFVLGNQYDQEAHEYLRPYFEEHKIKYLSSKRDQIIMKLVRQGKLPEVQKYQSMGDEDLFNLLVREKVQKEYSEGNLEDYQKEITEKFNKEILDDASNSINSFLKIKLMAIAFSKALSKPLNEISESKFISVCFIKPAQFLISPILIGVASVASVLSYTVGSIMLAALIIQGAILLAIPAVIGLPLYALDLCRYIISKISDKGQSNTVEEELKTDDTNNPLKGLNGAITNVSPGNIIEYNPTHYPSVLKSNEVHGSHGISTTNAYSSLTSNGLM